MIFSLSYVYILHFVWQERVTLLNYCVLIFIMIYPANQVCGKNVRSVIREQYIRWQANKAAIFSI